MVKSQLLLVLRKFPNRSSNKTTHNNEGLGVRYAKDESSKYGKSRPRITESAVKMPAGVHAADMTIYRVALQAV